MAKEHWKEQLSVLPAYELSYGSVSLQPLLFQDDIGRISTTLEEVQVGNKLESLKA